jgi:hypothetical protein
MTSTSEKAFYLQALIGRCDTQENDTQHNDTAIMQSVVTLSVVATLLGVPILSYKCQAWTEVNGRYKHCSLLHQDVFSACKSFMVYALTPT